MPAIVGTESVLWQNTSRDGVSRYQTLVHHRRPTLSLTGRSPARASRIQQYLATSPVVLVVTVLASAPVIYFAAQPQLVAPIARRWIIPEDLWEFVIYGLIVSAVLAALVRTSAPRYVLVVIGGAWTGILFGPGALLTVAAVGASAYFIGAWLAGRPVLEGRDPWPIPAVVALGYASLLGLFQ